MIYRNQIRYVDLATVATHKLKSIAIGWFHVAAESPALTKTILTYMHDLLNTEG